MKHISAVSWHRVVIDILRVKLSRSYSKSPLLFGIVVFGILLASSILGYIWQRQPKLGMMMLSSNDLPLELFMADMHFHLIYADVNQNWTLTSEVTISPDEDRIFEAKAFVWQEIEFQGLVDYLQTNGWKIDPINETIKEIALANLNKSEIEHYSKADNNHIISVDGIRHVARIKLQSLKGHKTVIYPEAISRWHLSNKKIIPIPTIPLLKRNRQSELILDAPTDMVRNTFPATKATEALIVNDYVRLHIPLEFAFDDEPHITLNIAYPTMWAKTVQGLKWLVTAGLKWLIGALAALIGVLVTAKLTKVTDRVKKRFEKKKDVGFAGGVNEQMNSKGAL